MSQKQNQPTNKQKLNLNNYHLEKINENLESNYKRFVRKIDKDYTFDHLSGYEVVKNNKKDFLKEFIIDYKFNDSYRIYLLLAHILNIIKYPQKKHISDIYISLNTLRNICAHANVYHFRDIDKYKSCEAHVKLIYIGDCGSFLCCFCSFFFYIKIGLCTPYQYIFGFWHFN